MKFILHKKIYRYIGQPEAQCTVNFDVLAQAIDFLIEKRQVVSSAYVYVTFCEESSQYTDRCFIQYELKTAI